jgi:hypothetical protein
MVYQHVFRSVFEPCVVREVHLFINKIKTYIQSLSLCQVLLYV